MTGPPDPTAPPPDPTADPDHCGDPLPTLLRGVATPSWCVRRPGHGVPHRDGAGAEWIRHSTPLAADDVWRWLLACAVCGEIHEFRRVATGRDAWTWTHPDGHRYQTRAGSSLGAIVRLRDRWNREEAR